MRRHVPRLALVVGLSLVLIGCATAAAPTWTFAPPAASPPAVEPGVPAGQVAVSAAGKISIEAFDLGFKPAMLSVAAAVVTVWLLLGQGLPQCLC